MINHEAIHLAARARARTLSVATVTQTFARASDATYIDSNGILQTVGPNVYRGFLETSGATNLLTAPNDFSNAAWVRGSVGAAPVAVAIAGLVTGPDGTLSASEISSDASQDITPHGTGTLSASFFIKRGTSSLVDIGVKGGASLANNNRYIARINWNIDGTIASFAEQAFPANGSISEVAALAAGWYRIVVTFSPGTEAVRGLGFQTNGFGTFVLSRVMLETGASATSYTPDTRAPESGTDLGLNATTTGYSRTSGSFVTDGFAVGMDVTPAGFTQTTPATITSVSALAMTVRGGRTAQGAGGARSLTTSLPVLIGYENISITPTTDVPYCVEEYLPGALAKVTVGAFGELEATPLYVLRLLYPQHTGMTALRRTSDALLTLFAPGTPLTVGSDIARVRNDLAPFPSPITQTGDGWASCTVTIPLRLRTTNSR